VARCARAADSQQRNQGKGSHRWLINSGRAVTRVGSRLFRKRQFGIYAEFEAYRGSPRRCEASSLFFCDRSSPHGVVHRVVSTPIASHGLSRAELAIAFNVSSVMINFGRESGKLEACEPLAAQYRCSHLPGTSADQPRAANRLCSWLHARGTRRRRSSCGPPTSWAG
jgi:hypothetical protein